MYALLLLHVIFYGHLFTMPFRTILLNVLSFLCALLLAFSNIIMHRAFLHGGLSVCGLVPTFLVHYFFSTSFSFPLAFSLVNSPILCVLHIHDNR